MTRVILSLFILLSCMVQAFPQTALATLPPGAIVLEKRPLTKASRPNRALMLWMISPKKYPTGYKRDDIYTCPDYTRGSHYSGPTRVSLINLKTGGIINTIKLELDYEDGNDAVDVPYAIRKGYYYHVEGPVKSGVEAKPMIIWLKDYNGDGKALEFAMFDAVACMGLGTTLIGYSEKSDRVIQYPFLRQPAAGTKEAPQTMLWVDYLFSKQPVRPGYWKYEVDYRGRGGQLDKWEIHYNREKERFEGTLVSVPDQ